MEKLISFIINVLDSRLTSVVISTFFLFVFFFLVQFFLFHIGNTFHINGVNCGIFINSILFAVIALWFRKFVLKNAFQDEESYKEYWVFVSFAFWAVVSIYIYIVFVYKWWLLALSLGIIIFSLSKLNSSMVKIFDIFASFFVLLLYCFSTYICMINLNMEPTIDVAGIVFVFITAFCLAFLHSYEY